MAEGGDTAATSQPPRHAPEISHDERSFKEAETILKNECEQIWKTIQKIQKDLDSKGDRTAGSSLEDIQREKERHLKAQIEVLGKCDPNLLPSNDVIQLELLRHEKLTSGLQDTLTLLKSEQQELDRGIQREEVFCNELQDVQKVLEEKLAATLANGTDNQENRDQTLLNELKEKETKHTAQYNKLMKDMAAFVGEHFPEPSEKDIEQWKKKNVGGSVSVSEDVEYLPLLVILQRMLNQYVDSPHDAYITITDQIWPPYVELLVRSCIAIRNPDNHQQIRLTPFDL